MLACTLSACGASGSNTLSANTASANASPPADIHNWIVHEKGAYGYSVAVSKEQSDAGQAAGEVLMFRYLGVENGEYRLSQDENPGLIATCANPCAAIKI